MNNIKFELVDITKIKPYKNNPRNNEPAIEGVANSIKEFGFKVPIVVDKDYVIINGHTRYYASQTLGLKRVPVIIADDLDEEKVKRYRLVDNKVGQLADWNVIMLSDEIAELKDYDFEKFGFSEIELMILLDDIEPNEFDKEAIDEYSQRADREMLKVRKLTIKYDNEQEKKHLKKLFNAPNLKVIYKCEELMRMEVS